MKNIKRNYFRKNFANQLLNEFSNGIKIKFWLFTKDIESLNIEISRLKNNELSIFKICIMTI